MMRPPDRAEPVALPYAWKLREWTEGAESLIDDLARWEEYPRRRSPDRSLGILVPSRNPPSPTLHRHGHCRSADVVGAFPKTIPICRFANFTQQLNEAFVLGELGKAGRKLVVELLERFVGSVRLSWAVADRIDERSHESCPTRGPPSEGHYSADSVPRSKRGTVGVRRPTASRQGS